jgi:redox-sensitive bicupin YhaK (pirin superfamily)
VLHEEMWALPPEGSHIELFQIWINLPDRLKREQPSLQIVGSTSDSEALSPSIPEVSWMRRHKLGGVL